MKLRRDGCLIQDSPGVVDPIVFVNVIVKLHFGFGLRLIRVIVRRNICLVGVETEQIGGGESYRLMDVKGRDLGTDGVMEGGGSVIGVTAEFRNDPCVDRKPLVSYIIAHQKGFIGSQSDDIVLFHREIPIRHIDPAELVEMTGGKHAGGSKETAP